MITIDQSGIVLTDKLLDRIEEETAEATRAVKAGEKYKFKGLYKDDEIKGGLMAAQHGKCCFCESHFDHIDYGDVEHFRPKGGFKQRNSDSLSQPGYYWLAYQLENLFLSCKLCNQRFKKNFFPLADPNARARSAAHDLAAEQPLLLDPGRDDPDAHLVFEKEVLKPINGSARGKNTILRTGLSRQELMDYRLEYLQVMKYVAKSARDDADEDQAEALSIMHKAGSSAGQYSKMIRDNFPEFF